MIVCLLRHRALQRIIDETYQDYLAKINLTMAENCHIESGKDFSEVRETIYNPTIIDNRTGDEVIEDTFRKHGLKIKKEGE
jgi:hypothetical protein